MNQFDRLEPAMRFVLSTLLGLLLLPATIYGQEKVAQPAGLEGSTAQQKRAWIYDHLVAPVQNRELVRRYTRKLEGMNDKQLDATIASYQRQLAQRQKLQQQQRRAAMYRQQYVGNSGFRPIVTWLPTGTNMTASAVVSPDRRYVRMSLAPFFSSIPRVDTFNYVTGESRNIYDSHPTNSGSHSRNQPPAVRPQHSWYKKIRTIR